METPHERGNGQATEYRYNRLSWPEVNDVIARQKFVILRTEEVLYPTDQELYARATGESARGALALLSGAAAL